MRIQLKHQPVIDSLVDLATKKGMTPTQYVTHLISTQAKLDEAQGVNINDKGNTISK